MNSTPFMGQADLSGLGAAARPPTIAAIDAVWCGSRNGRIREMPLLVQHFALGQGMDHRRFPAPSPRSVGGRMPGNLSRRHIDIFFFFFFARPGAADHS